MTDEAPESGQDRTEGAKPQSAGVTRWRTKPVTVEMIQWDGNGKTWCLIAEHGGHPERPNPDGSLNIWDCREDGEVALERGDWAAIDPNPPGFAVEGVYRVAATALEAAYEPVSSAGTPPEGLGGADEGAREPFVAGSGERDVQEFAAVRTAPDQVTVGEVRALLAKHGIPHTDDTHYAIVATTGGDLGELFFLNCCDDVGHATELLAEALENLTGDCPVLMPDSPNIVVGREDLRAALAKANPYVASRERAPFDRLSAAAGEGS